MIYFKQKQQQLFLFLLLLLLSRFSRVQLCATHRRQPTWVSPGKNTGVGCHFLLQCMKVKSESEVTQSCPTLSDPMDCSPPGSSVHGILQARVLEWVTSVFLLVFKAQHSGSSFSWQKNPNLRSPLWGFDLLFLGETLSNCDYPLICGEPTQWCEP